MNQYQSTIKEIGTQLSYYDPKKIIQVYGFGGQLEIEDSESNKEQGANIFPLNGQQNQPEVQDISGVLELYQKINQQGSVVMGSRRLLTPIIKQALHQAKKYEMNVYQVLIVIAAGEFEDFNESLLLINDCSQMPLSIVIVGVGENPFERLKLIDDYNTFVTVAQQQN